MIAIKCLDEANDKWNIVIITSGSNIFVTLCWWIYHHIYIILKRNEFMFIEKPGQNFNAQYKVIWKKNKS